jgi:hypothetical protein
MEQPFRDIEQSERSDQTDDAQDGRDAKNQAHVPRFGLVAVADPVVCDRQTRDRRSKEQAARSLRP